MIRDDYSNGFQQFAAANNQVRLASRDSQIQSLTPTASDVICGRGKKVFEHEGNVQFRAIVLSKLPDYKAAVSKAQKSAVVSSVFDEVTVDGNFIKQNPQTERWYVVNEAAAREKISQCFRDCLNDKHDSNKSSKAKKRKQTKEQVVKSTKPSTTKAAPETDSLPPPPKRTKLFRSHTAPPSIAYSSSDAFQQLVMFSRSVMPPARRSNSLQFSNTTSATWFEDMEPLSYNNNNNDDVNINNTNNIEPISFPSFSFFPDLEPTPLAFQGNAGQRPPSP